MRGQDGRRLANMIVRHGRWGAAGAALFAAACGGGGNGGGAQSTPAPIATPTPIASPSPAPTATATPAAAFDTAEYRQSDGPAFHRAIPAWQQGANGQGVTIAVIDTGIDTANPEFAGRISSASADVAGNRGIQSEDFHGPMVALVAAAARNDSGIMGIAWQADVMALRADTPGSCASSDGCRFAASAIASGIDRAVSNGAKVINISLGSDSDPGAGVRAAITRAANAGVVVIVAAGNQESGETATQIASPEAFAVALRQAGNGNVIIAGAVDGAGVISTGSHHAGSEASAFLAALGDEVCCIYENGQIKVTTSGGRQFYTVVSGTSFAAPQIAGAAALLRQAFPNLTAAQVVDLLLRTARDAGASGTDAIYGRGVLDIGNAFAPQGATTLAGGTTALPIGATGVTTSAAMGDAVQGAALGATVLDSYQRAYRVAAGLRAAPLSARLAPALASRGFSSAAGPVAISYSLDARARPQGGAWNGQLRLGPQDAERARVLAARVAARIAPGTDLAFAFAQGSDGLAAQVRGARGPAFLIAGSPRDDTGFARADQVSIALRRQLGDWGLTLKAEAGEAAAPLGERLGRWLPERRRDAVTQVGLAVDRAWGPFALALEANWMAEDRTLLGARLHDALGGGGADTLFLDADLAWYPGGPWRVGAAWRQGFTHARPLGAVTSDSRFVSDSWSLDVSRAGLFQPDDTLALRVSQPLRVRSGGVGLLLPVSWDYETLTPGYAVNRISFAPSGREIDLELAWNGTLRTGTAAASLFYRKDPGHYAGMPDDKGAALSWSTVF